MREEVDAGPTGESLFRVSLQEDPGDKNNCNHLEGIPTGADNVVKEPQSLASQDVTSKCRSFLHHINNESRQSHNHRKRSRIMVTGPIKSGKSSLAMNFAYSNAISAAPCLCLDARMCRCIAVTMYRPVVQLTKRVSLGDRLGATTNSPDSTDNFPLMCRYIDAPMESNKQQSKNAKESIEWDPQILKRIRVHRISNVRELLHELLSLLGKPLQDQPRSGGAIIIDDLDMIVARDVNIVRMSQGNAHWNGTTSAILQVGLYCITWLQSKNYDIRY
jgi:adenosyl cobinamide kinase/adenosyl cobinamide phosphate guanylyltransferase